MFFHSPAASTNTARPCVKCCVVRNSCARMAGPRRIASSTPWPIHTRCVCWPSTLISGWSANFAASFGWVAAPSQNSGRQSRCGCWNWSWSPDQSESNPAASSARAARTTSSAGG